MRRHRARGMERRQPAPAAAVDAIERWTEPRLGIELIAIPPGDFGMGSPPDEPMRERASTV
ncbi:MAG TPA: hypothetical protein VHJ77_11820 [Vicinamibacterales bacterium]|nr:hypothetical protein [Vicinamibacterales bacterium]